MTKALRKMMSSEAEVENNIDNSVDGFPSFSGAESPNSSADDGDEIRAIRSHALGLSEWILAAVGSEDAYLVERELSEDSIIDIELSENLTKFVNKALHGLIQLYQELGFII